MERKLNKIYSEAYNDIAKKWNAFMDAHKGQLESAYKDLQDALKGGDRLAIKEARSEYERIAKNITINNQRFKEMSDEVAQKMAHVDEVALKYVNGEMPKVYTTNYNAFGDTKIKGYNFSLVNENAVRELAVNDKLMLPRKMVNLNKTLAWNEKMINSQVIQGILQGESIPTMAKRLKNVAGMSTKSAIRNARTMTTAAENKGRQDSFEKAQEDGVIMEREWIATGDDRTRDWHAELDGVMVGVDEPWENEYGEIMYPGDPSADPANVYNCRCSIRAHVKGFRWSDNANIEEEEANIKEEESKPSDNLTFVDGISEEQRELISELYDEYDSRLESISKGAERAAGDVDITGTTMRLSSKDPSVALHEFAHTLANIDADKYGLTHDESFWKEIKRIRREYLNDVKYDTNKWISSYEHSHKKIDEFMAESFALAKGKEMDIKLPSKYGQDLTYANKVLEVVDKYFRRKHK